jgi:hypothetical protein
MQEKFPSDWNQITLYVGDNDWKETSLHKYFGQDRKLAMKQEDTESPKKGWSQLALQASSVEDGTKSESESLLEFSFYLQIPDV